MIDVALALALLALVTVAALAIHALRKDRARRKRLVAAYKTRFTDDERRALNEIVDRPRIPDVRPAPIERPRPREPETAGWDAPGDNGGGYSGNTGKVDE
jgi:predicted dehydrogenase